MRLECYCIRGGNYARNDEGWEGGGCWARPSSAGRSNEFEHRQSSLLQTNRCRDDLRMTETRSRDFLVFKVMRNDIKIGG